MSFIKRLLKREKKQFEPMRGSAPVHSEADQDASRKNMEAQMLADRERRAGSETNKTPPPA